MGSQSHHAVDQGLVRADIPFHEVALLGRIDALQQQVVDSRVLLRYFIK